MQGDALFECFFKLVGQVSAETAADGKLSGMGQLCLGTGRTDALTRRIQRYGEQERYNQRFTAF